MKLGDVVRAIEPYFIANSKPSQRDFALCHRYAKWMKIVAPGTVGFYVAIVFTIMIESFMSGSMRPCLLVYFVGIREYSIVSMTLLHLYNYAMIILTIVTVSYVDTLVFLALLSIMLLSYHFQAEISEFNDDSKQKKLSPKEVEQRLNDIIMMHQEYAE